MEERFGHTMELPKNRAKAGLARCELAEAMLSGVLHKIEQLGVIVKAGVSAGRSRQTDDIILTPDKCYFMHPDKG